MSLASMTPAKQVAHVIAHCKPGEFPELPPFLKVTKADAERRAEEWEKNPPKAFVWTAPADSDRAAEERRFRESARLEKEQADAKLHAELDAKRKKFTAGPRDTTGFRWDTRRGRFVPDGYSPKTRPGAPPDAEELKAAAAVDAENAARSKGKKPKAVAPKVAAPLPKPDVPKLIEGESKLAKMIRLLKRTEGATLEEIATETGWLTHSAQARIGADLRKQGVCVERTDEERGKVYRIHE